MVINTKLNMYLKSTQYSKPHLLSTHFVTSVFVSQLDSMANLAALSMDFINFHVVPAQQASRSEEWVWIMKRSMRHCRLRQRYQAVDSERRRPGKGRLGYHRAIQYNMHRGQVPGHCRGGLTPFQLGRLKACEAPWVLTAGAADILRAV